MPSDDQLDDILGAWQEAFERGTELPAAELCRGCPERLPEVQQRIELMRRVLALCPVAAPADVPTLTDAGGTCPDESLERHAPPGFVLEGELGRGAMGVVYRAREVTLSRAVALKVMRHGTWADATGVARFRLEATSVAKLDHPNVVKVHQFGVHEGVPYLALEYCGGGSLDQKIADSPLEPRPAAETVAALARGVHAAHRAGIVHRDLKPANVLLSADGTPKVSDFGLAKWAEDSDVVTATGAVLGTPSYMAPEQARGDNDGTDVQSDVYALGAILYACLTGHAPFKAASSHGTIALVLGADPVRVRDLQPGVPPDLETICLKCLQKAPDRRYGSATELAEDLQRFLDGRPILARPVGRAERAWRWCRRNPAVALLLAGVLSTSLTGTGVSIWYATKANVAAGVAQHKEEEARRAQERELTALIDVHAAVGLSIPVAGDQANPAQAALWFARAAELAQNDTQRAWANRARSASYGLSAPAPVRAFRQPGSPPWKLDFHPRGQHLLVCAMSGEFTLYDLVTERLMPLPGGLTTARAAAWSPDGEHIALGASDGKLCIFSFPDGKLTEEADCADGISVLKFDPTGRFLASAGRTVRIWDRKLQSFAAPPLEHGGKIEHLVFNRRGDRLATSGGGQVRCFAVPSEASTRPLFDPASHVPSPKWGLRDMPPLFVDNDRGLVTHPGGGTLSCLDPSTGKKRWEATFPPAHRLESWAVSHDGKHLAAGGFMMTRLYDAANGKPVGAEVRYRNSSFGVTFSPDGRTAINGSSDRTVRLMSVPDGTPIGGPLVHPNDVYAVGFSPRGSCFATAQKDGLIRLWQVGPSRPPMTAPFEVGYWNVPACVSPDERHVLSVSLEARTARVHALKTGSPVATLSGLDKPVRSANFSADGRRVLLLTTTDIRVWSWDAGGQKVIPLESDAPPDNWALSPDGRVAAVVYRSIGKVVMLNTSDWSELRRVSHPNTARSLKGFYARARFSPSGRLLATFGMGNEVRVWHADTGREACPPLRHGDRCQEVSFSPNERLIATGSYDNTARVWDVYTGAAASEPLRHPDTLHQPAFSPDGELLATGCRDGMARVWKWREGLAACPHMGHTDEVEDVNWSPDGRILFTGTRDGFGRAWDGQAGKPLTPPLRPGSAGRATPSPSGEYVFYTREGRGSRLTAYRLSDLGLVTHPLPARDAKTLAELAAGQSIFEAGAGIISLTSDEWLERWQTFRRTHPDYHSAPFRSRAGE